VVGYIVDHYWIRFGSGLWCWGWFIKCNTRHERCDESLFWAISMIICLLRISQNRHQYNQK
jgi:hypothetical protein